MKKRMAGVTAVLTALCLLAGCGSNPAVTNRELREMKVGRYVTLGDYNDISVTVPAPKSVSQSEWDELLLAVYQSYVTADNGSITNRAAVSGDTVIIDYVGKKDGAAFAGGTASNASLTLGSKQFIDGFEDGLIGVMPGTTVDLNLSFPEGYGNADLAGQAVVFTVTLNYILPNADEMQDSVVAAQGTADVATVEELRQYVYDYLQRTAEEEYTYNVQNAIMDQILNRCTVEELPQTFVESYNHAFRETLENAAGSYGVDAETYANYFMGMSSEDYVSRYSKLQAEQDVLLQAIANQEKLTVSDEELQEKLEEYTAQGGYASVEEMLGFFDREEYRNFIMSEKVMNFLMQNANITTQ